MQLLRYLSMNKVFYISGNGLKIFEWHRSSLQATITFDRSPRDLEELDHYLANSCSTPIRIAVDLIEEEFRSESIPKLYSKERKAVISRLLDRHLRDVEHVKVISNGTVKTTRKEEELLIASVPNFEEVQPWLDIFSKHNIPVVGIWSVPLLQESFLKLIENSNDNVLLVSRDVPWTQRETFVKSGKVRFSRLEKLDVDLTGTHCPNESLALLQKGTEQIRHYLTNHRIVNFTDTITVYCFVDQGMQQEYESLIQNNTMEQLEFRFISLESILALSKVESPSYSGADAIVAWACRSKSSLTDHYATNAEKIGYFHYLWKKSTQYSAFAVSVAFFALASVFMLDAYRFTKQEISAQADLNFLLDVYDQRYTDIEARLELAIPIDNSAELLSGYKNTSQLTPQSYFIALSSVYSDDRYDNIRLDGLDWSTHNAEQLSEYIASQVNDTSSLSDEGLWDEESENLATDGYADHNELLAKPIIKLKGYFNSDGLDHRSTVTKMANFTSDLSALSIVEELYVIKTPVDVRPESVYKDQDGSLVANRVVEDNSHYELLLVLKPEAI